MDQIGYLFAFINPTRIELVIRKISDKIDPLDEMDIPKDIDVNFLHIAITSSEWEGNVTPELVEEIVDEMNKWIVQNTSSDSLVGSLYFLNDDSENLPEMLKKYDIPIDEIPYEYYKIP